MDKIAVLKNGDIILNKLSDDGTKSLISFNSEFEQINEEKTNIDIIDILQYNFVRFLLHLFRYSDTKDKCI